MNLRIISKLLGLIIIFIGLSMIPACAWGFYYREKEAVLSILLSMVIILALGGLLTFLGRGSAKRLYRKEAIAIVGSAWLIGAALGGLPFYLSGTLPAYIDSFFEAMSGFATSGSTVLQEIESTPKSILFWRSFTHWLGGMGIIVLFVAVLPFLGVGGRELFKREFSSATAQDLKPRIKDTAGILWKIYITLSIIEVSVLLACGMSFFDALCHTFGSMGTGGFSTKTLSIGHYNSVAIELIIMLFMILAGTNFTLYFQLLRGRRKSLFNDPEWRVYISLLAISILFVSTTLLLSGTYPTIRSSLRYGSFQVVSIMTCTGFTTANFDNWPYVCKLLLILLMFVGGCSGSTSGGIKVIRISILFKSIMAHIARVINPKQVRRVTVGSILIDEELQKIAFGFFGLYIFIFCVASFIMTLLGVDIITSVSSVAATLNMVGPGLGGVSPARDFASLPQAGKLLLSFCMAIGRLELFSILAFFTPYFWRRT
ncbi:MAG TPA: TrkH family potassium uptake protein [Candidatus Omnitrophica bacterium]|nr:TrkH family potassium uptake protein [Candidatus Omnitrophota bacterium]